jgi:hypothetical protein
MKRYYFMELSLFATKAIAILLIAMFVELKTMDSCCPNVELAIVHIHAFR